MVFIITFINFFSYILTIKLFQDDSQNILRYCIVKPMVLGSCSETSTREVGIRVLRFMAKMSMILNTLQLMSLNKKTLLLNTISLVCIIWFVYLKFPPPSPHSWFILSGSSATNFFK